VRPVQVWLGCGVEAIDHAQGRVQGLYTTAGPLAADRVIVAAGTATSALLGDLGVRLPMLRRPGLLLQTRPVAPRIRHILVSPEQELRQDAEGRLIAPTSAAHQSDATETITELPGSLADQALERVRRMLPDARLDWDCVMLADRPVPADGLPVVGACGPAGVYAAVLHSGMTLAPLIGKLVADEVLTGDAAPMLAPYRPGRFG
jgi:D-hydroxyproline dehydrogenase subunit beta